MNPGALELAKWARELGMNQFIPVTIEGHEGFLSPSGSFVSSESQEEAPRRIRQKEEFIDATSFATYVNEFKMTPTILVGSVSAATVTAKIDYHAKGAPSWCSHEAALKSVATPEWVALKSIQDKWLSQIDFAEFLDRWNPIFVDPQSAAMCEVAMNLEGAVGGKFAAKINRANGAATFTYQEDVTTGNVTVPSKALVSLRPHYHSKDLVDVLLQVRFRVNEGSPKFQLVIPNPQRVEYDSLTASFAEVAALIGQPVLIAP